MMSQKPSTASVESTCPTFPHDSCPLPYAQSQPTVSLRNASERVRGLFTRGLTLDFVPELYPSSVHGGITQAGDHFPPIVITHMAERPGLAPAKQTETTLCPPPTFLLRFVRFHIHETNLRGRGG